MNIDVKQIVRRFHELVLLNRGGMQLMCVSVYEWKNSTPKNKNKNKMCTNGNIIDHKRNLDHISLVR